MKILNLRVEGFRSLKSVDWSPGDLNVVIGPNAGGKSNLLQLLKMIAASARGKLSKFVKRQGGMQPLVWDGKAETIQIELETSIPYAGRVKEDKDSKFIIQLERLGKTSSYKINTEELSMFYVQKENEEKPQFKQWVRQASLQTVLDELEHNVTDSYSENESLLTLIIPPRRNRWFTDYKKNLSSWSIYSEFNTGRDAPVRQAVVTSYDKHIEPDGQNLVAVLHTLYEENRDFKNEIDSAMRAAFGDDFEELSFPPAADGRTQLRIRWKSLTTGQSAANLSDGTLRFLYLLTILANPDPPALIAIDEPETGLHPSMLSIIAEYAAEAARNTQVIFTTHSAEMLNAFSETRPTVTVCEWHDGQTELHVLAGEKLDYWLGKYSLGELFRTGELENMK
ncbi:MAG: AAA family ATPase [Sedimentisphaerales bacterium]|nr:AAA family ATPase [Sedimentisphaerales bacterium]